MALEAPNPPLLMADHLDIPQDNGPFKSRITRDEMPQRVWDEGLGSFDVFSLIVNKMIGTGIYTSPAVVYRMTGSKSITLALFGVGFVYCLMSTAIYLQYAEVLPYNGGELIYLDEITASEKPPLIDAPTNAVPQPGGPGIRHYPPTEPSSRSTGFIATFTRWYRKLMGDGLLAYIIYALAFIIFFNSATNSQQFGRMILLCIHADKEDNENDVKSDQHLMRYIAVTILSIICLAQFFSPGFGRRLNKFLAVIKIGFLIGLIAVGLSALGKDLKDVSKRDSDRALDWSQRHEVDHSKVSFAKALLVVLFSFEGWENATFVAGEIPRSKQKVLRRGFLAAAFTVGSLYLVVVAVSLHSLRWEEVDKRGSNINYAPLLTGDTAASRRAWAIIIAISAFGSLNAIIYTFSRVKQVIGQAEVLPWSRFLKQDDCLNRRQRTRENAFHYKSPQGGLIAHWVASVALIAISASIQSTLESVGLAGYIQTYTHCFVLMILGIGYLNLRSRNESLNSLQRTEDQSTPAGRFFEALILVSTPIYVLLNLAILVINAVPPYRGSGDQDSVFPGYGFPVIVASLVTVGTLYYLLFFGAVYRYYEAIPSDEGSEEELPRPRVCEGIISPTSPLNLMKYAGVVCEMRKDYSYRSVERVFRFGRRWKMIYSLTGYDSEDSNTPTLKNQGLTFGMALYWVFGGTRLKEDRTPWAKLKERTEWLFWW